jgi:hypothetical protein
LVGAAAQQLKRNENWIADLEGSRGQGLL